MVVLYREEFNDVVHIVQGDVEARYMLIRVHTNRPRDIYMAVCYFPPAHSRYAPQGESPYMPLYEEIMRYASMGDILLVGDFNARTSQRQSAFYDMEEPIYRELALEEMGLRRTSQDTGEVIEYGTHFLALGSAHRLAIYNGLSRWPGSDALTCWNPKGRASTVDYVMGSPTLIPEVQSFIISSRPIGASVDHSHLILSLACGHTRDITPSHLPQHPRYHFTQDTIYIICLLLCNV